MFHLHLESPFSDVLTKTRAKRNCQQRQGNIDELLLDIIDIEKFEYRKRTQIGRNLGIKKTVKLTNDDEHCEWCKLLRMWQ